MFWLLIFPDSLQCIISAHLTNSNARWTVHLLGGFWLNESNTWLFAVARSSQLWFCLWGLGQVYFTIMWDFLQRSWPLRWLFADANAISFSDIICERCRKCSYRFGMSLVLVNPQWWLGRESGTTQELKICSIFSAILALYRDRWKEIESYPSAILALWKDLLKEILVPFIGFHQCVVPCSH